MNYIFLNTQLYCFLRNCYNTIKSRFKLRLLWISTWLKTHSIFNCTRKIIYQIIFPINIGSFDWNAFSFEFTRKKTQTYFSKYIFLTRKTLACEDETENVKIERGRLFQSTHEKKSKYIFLHPSKSEHTQKFPEPLSWPVTQNQNKYFLSLKLTDFNRRNDYNKMIKILFTQNNDGNWISLSRTIFFGKTNEKHDSTMMTTLFKTFLSYLWIKLLSNYNISSFKNI